MHGSSKTKICNNDSIADINMLFNLSMFMLNGSQIKINTQSTLAEVNTIIICCRNGWFLNIIQGLDYGQLVVYKASS